MAKITTVMDVLHHGKRLPAGEQYNTKTIKMDDDTVSALASVGAIDIMDDKPASEPEEKPEEK